MHTLHERGLRNLCDLKFSKVV